MTTKTHDKTHELPSTKVRMIALNRLVPSKDNARKRYAEGEVEQMAASLLSHGQLQNVVVQEGRGELLEVTAGGKRLAALKLLAKQGKIKKDHAVACQARDREDAAEITLAENIIRSDMHPADEIVAYGKLNKEKNIPAEEIAARYGVSAMTVRRRLKLASLSPKIMEAFRKDEANLLQLEALALTDDQGLQESLFFTEHEWQRSPQTIRKALSQDGVPASSALVSFVSIGSYEEAGGKVVRDLFDDRNSGYLTDQPLLVRLATAKLEEAAKAYEGKGWKWIELSLEDHHWNYRNVEPVVSLSARDQKRADKWQARLEELCALDEASEDEQAEIDKIEAQISELEQANQKWTDEAKAISGVYVTVGREGKVQAYEGLQSADDRKLEERKAKLVQAEAGASDDRAEAASLSAAVIEDLSKLRTVALANAFADNPSVSLRALAFSLIQSGLRHGQTGNAFKISLTRPDLRIDQPDTDNTLCYVALEQKKQALLLELPQDAAGLWNHLLGVSQEKVIEYLALCLALAVDVVVPRHGHAEPRALGLAGMFAGTLGFNMGDWWKPSQAFFKRVPKSVAVQALAATGAPPAIGEGLAKLKKEEAVSATLAGLEGKAWLPEPIASFPALPVLESFPSAAFDEEAEEEEAAAEEADEAPFELAEEAA